MTVALAIVEMESFVPPHFVMKSFSPIWFFRLQNWAAKPQIERLDPRFSEKRGMTLSMTLLMTLSPHESMMYHIVITSKRERKLQNMTVLTAPV